MNAMELSACLLLQFQPSCGHCRDGAASSSFSRCLFISCEGHSSAIRMMFKLMGPRAIKHYQSVHSDFL